jgi:nicotinamide riboside transporter PnuC
MTKLELDILTWFLFVVSFIGAIYNIKKRILGFVIWASADVVFVAMYIYLHQYPNAALFGMYTGINCYGIYKWGQK